MDDPLQRLVSELQRESCPPEVMERVARGVAKQKGARFRYGWAWGIAFLTVLIALGAWQQRRSGREAEKEAVKLEAQLRSDRTRIAEETAGALGYVGQVLLEVAAQSQDSILKEAVPPLRDSLETTKNKVIKNI